jgi:transcriptional regulator with PAS, ATPase and Fis domain
MRPAAPAIAGIPWPGVDESGSDPVATPMVKLYGWDATDLMFDSAQSQPLTLTIALDPAPDPGTVVRMAPPSPPKQSQDLPKVPLGLPVAAAIERLLAAGRTAALVQDPEGQVHGVFDLRAFLEGNPPGAAWEEGALVEDHLLGPGRAPVAHPPLDPADFWRELMQTVLSAGRQPPVALLGAAEQILYANDSLRATFPDVFTGRAVFLRDLLPGHPVGREPESGPTSFYYVQHGERSFMVILVRRLPEGLGALVLQELTGHLAEGHRKALEEVDLLKRVLEISVDGLQLVNTEGIITLVNESFLKLHRLSRAECEGVPVTQLIPTTRMHIVARTGMPELDELQHTRGRDYVVSRIPVFKDGKCIGAVGKVIFQDFEEIQRLAVKTRRLQQELEELRKTKVAPRPETRFTFDDIVAQADASRSAKERAMMGAPTLSTILLLGESGVGKEVFAQAIHNLSPRYSRPFVRVNCSAITESLFESELFGYAEGAFTGAKKGGRAGKFELANGGTIFLDEIGDMPLDTQAKLLRVLQEREIDKVGGEGTIPVDVRVIAATNQSLWSLVEQKKFRRDLFFRLNVIPITIPPLRDRRADIPELARRFWADLQVVQGIRTKGLTDGAKRLLVEYSWPGNTRELRNTLERAFTIVRGNEITENQVRMVLLSEGSCNGHFEAQEEGTLEGVVAMAERRAIALALARTNNNKVQTARQLGISRPLLYRKMSLYGLS